MLGRNKHLPTSDRYARWGKAPAPEKLQWIEPDGPAPRVIWVVMPERGKDWPAPAARPQQNWCCGGDSNTCQEGFMAFFKMLGIVVLLGVLIGSIFSNCPPCPGQRGQPQQPTATARP
jgi:hypothetical protein